MSTVQDMERTNLEMDELHCFCGFVYAIAIVSGTNVRLFVSFSHQFKLERWMDYGPTIAAAYASHNEREVYNLRTVFSEMMKRAPQDKAVTSIGQPRDNPYAGENVRTVDSSNLRYGSPESNMQFANNGANSQRQMYHSSSASHGRLDYGRAGGGSVRSQQSQGVFSTGPIERQSADPVRQYVSGYRGQSAGSNGRY